MEGHKPAEGSEDPAEPALAWRASMLEFMRPGLAGIF